MTAQEIQLAPEIECLRCGYKWRPRRAVVKRCSRCKTPYWDQPRKNKRKEEQP